MKTKKLKYYFLLAGLAIVALSSCKKEYEPIGDPYTAADGLNGSWILSKVVQIDEASPLKDARDLSTIYGIGGTDPLMGIQFDAATHKFHMNTGKGKNFLAPGFKDINSVDSLRLKGDWTFSNEISPNYADKAPKGVQMINDYGDTVNLELLAPIRSFDQELGIKIVRCKLSYNYYFDRQN